MLPFSAILFQWQPRNYVGAYALQKGSRWWRGPSSLPLAPIFPFYHGSSTATSLFQLHTSCMQEIKTSNTCCLRDFVSVCVCVCGLTSQKNRVGTFLLSPRGAMTAETSNHFSPWFTTAQAHPPILAGPCSLEGRRRGKGKLILALTSVSPTGQSLDQRQYHTTGSSSLRRPTSAGRALTTVSASPTCFRTGTSQRSLRRLRRMRGREEAPVVFDCY